MEARARKHVNSAAKLRRGGVNLLAGRIEVEPGTPSFGRALEHLIYCELRAWQEYRHDDRRLTFWRARDGSEVDFVIGDEIAIEVKGSPSVTDRDLVGLRRLAEETSLRKSIVVSLETAPRRVGAVDILPAREFLYRLWDGAIAQPRWLALSAEREDSRLRSTLGHDDA